MPTNEEELTNKLMLELACPTCLHFPCTCSGGGDDNDKKQQADYKKFEVPQTGLGSSPFEAHLASPTVTNNRSEENEIDKEEEVQIGPGFSR